MHTISFDKKAVNITIRNLYPRLELTYPVYCSNSTACHVSPGQKTGTSTTMEASFGINSKRNDLKCALLYALQRKYTTRTDNRPNDSTVFIEDTATSMYLLVACYIKDHERRFHVCLIECDDNFTWDEDKLWKLYRKYNDQVHNDYKSGIVTWLMHDGTVVKMWIDITHGSSYKLDIIISERAGKCKMEEPKKIDTKRLVLSLHILVMLMYVVSLSIEPSVELNIHNLCSNIDLVSPTYKTDSGSKCHSPPDDKVYADDTMRSSFAFCDSNDCSKGVLIYRLQRRQTHESTESGEDTSSSAHLLVIWQVLEHLGLYADVLLIKHDEELDWNKIDLMSLHRENFGRLKQFPDPAKETWLMNDNTTLKVTFEIMNRDWLLNVTISEIERYNGARIPPLIDPRR
jgi:hypothetical protein